MILSKSVQQRGRKPWLLSSDTGAVPCMECAQQIGLTSCSKLQRISLPKEEVETFSFPIIFFLYSKDCYKVTESNNRFEK